MKETIDVEYEGQTWSLNRASIAGLSDKQILELLSPGFPGIANGKLTWAGEDRIVINKAVGKKGSADRDLLKILSDQQPDPFPDKLAKAVQVGNRITTIAQWEQYDNRWGELKIQAEMATRRRSIDDSIQALLGCQSRTVPWF